MAKVVVPIKPLCPHPRLQESVGYIKSHTKEDYYALYKAYHSTLLYHIFPQGWHSAEFCNYP